MNSIFLIIAAAALVICIMRHYHQQQLSILYHFTQQQDALIDALNKMGELISTYGEQSTQLHFAHCESHALILATLQFDLMAIKERAMQNEQYELLNDIETLIEEVQNAIKGNQL